LRFGALRAGSGVARLGFRLEASRVVVALGQIWSQLFGLGKEFRGHRTRARVGMALVRARACALLTKKFWAPGPCVTFSMRRQEGGDKRHV